MEYDSKTLQALLVDVSKKLERHEWRISDLEKRLMHAQLHDEDMHLSHEEIDLNAFKDPILKKATVRESASLLKVLQPHKGLTWYAVYVCGGATVIAGISYWMITMAYIF